MHAQERLPRDRAYARYWAKRTADEYAGHFTHVRLDGFGEDAWRIQEDFEGGQGQAVTYGRRANLVLQLHISESFRPCHSDIRSAAHARVDAIDNEARTRL